MKVNNLDLNVQILGDGVPFVWGHGLMSSIALEDQTGWFDWNILKDIARVVRYDARGHGLSQSTHSPEGYRWSSLAKDMIAVADQSGLDTFIAGGQSMGCATAIYAALEASERVKALVLVTPPTAWEARAAQAAIYEQLAALVEREGVGALIGLMQQQSQLPAWLVEAQSQTAQDYLEMIQNLDKKELAMLLRGAKLCDLPPRDELKKLSMPALILPWSGDAAHPLAVAEELARLLPQSHMVVANCIEDVKAWMELMRGFITSPSSI